MQFVATIALLIILELPLSTRPHSRSVIEQAGELRWYCTGLLQFVSWLSVAMMISYTLEATTQASTETIEAVTLEPLNIIYYVESTVLTVSRDTYCQRTRV